MKIKYGTLRIKSDIKKITKYIKALSELEYKSYASNFEEKIIINNSINSLGDDELNKHIYYERLLYALNYLKLAVAYKEFELGLLSINNGMEDELIFQEEIKVLQKLCEAVIKNPIGYTTIDSLYECYASYDDALHISDYMEEAFNFLQGKEGLYQKYYTYFKMRYDNKYSHDYLAKLIFGDYDKRYNIFNAVYYGKNFKSIIKAIANYDLKSYQNKLDDEYVKVLDKLY
ncbi:MAG: hypothetical protein J5892_00230 [Bacilli bacterium]|nr:hypothetical protein [Bacilli bacterium]